MKKEIVKLLGVGLICFLFGYSLNMSHTPIQKSNYIHEQEEIIWVEAETEEEESIEEKTAEETSVGPVETEVVQSPTPKPTKTPKPTSTPKPSIRYVGATVYITQSGKKFHREDCSSLSKSKIPILFEEACEKNYEPCGKCNP